MEPQTCSTTEAPVSSADLQQQLAARIGSLSYLPTTAAVAIKFVELGKNPLAEPADYAKVIGADSSLSSKLLALSNSSWAGVRTKVTSVRMAVNLLGLGTVRTLAISYCMTGLHNELRLTPAESEAFWEASLSKAVAAKRYASLFDVKLADEAFVAGLFQDLAITVMYSVVRQLYLKLLQDPQTGVDSQLQSERDLFGIDHTEVGRALAQKLELPEMFVDTIAFHHNYERLTEFVDAAPLRDATYVAALFPHALDAWHYGDVQKLSEFFQKRGAPVDMSTYVADVQAEFAQLYTFFNEGLTPHAQLTDLLAQTARENADQTTALVGSMNALLREAAAQGAPTPAAVPAPQPASDRDAVTGVLNRAAFTVAAEKLLAQAARYGVALGVACIGIDQLKAAYDQHGKAFGDHVLRTVVAELGGVLPSDALITRWTDDQFIVLINSCRRGDATEGLNNFLGHLARHPFSDGEHKATIDVHGGLLFVQASNRAQTLETVAAAAEKLMHAARKSGAPEVQVRAV